MSHRDEDIFFLGLVFCIIAFLLGGAVGGLLGDSLAESRMEDAAVQHGCAHFPVVDSLTGATEFRWRSK